MIWLLQLVEVQDWLNVWVAPRDGVARNHKWKKELARHVTFPMPWVTKMESGVAIYIYSHYKVVTLHGTKLTEVT